MSSLSKPFMTDNTTINTATASAMPIIETAEMNEIKLWLLRVRRYRTAIDSS